MLYHYIERWFLGAGKRKILTSNTLISCCLQGRPRGELRPNRLSHMASNRLHGRDNAR